MRRHSLEICNLFMVYEGFGISKKSSYFTIFKFLGNIKNYEIVLTDPRERPTNDRYQTMDTPLELLLQTCYMLSELFALTTMILSLNIFSDLADVLWRCATLFHIVHVKSRGTAVYWPGCSVDREFHAIDGNICIISIMLSISGLFSTLSFIMMQTSVYLSRLENCLKEKDDIYTFRVQYIYKVQNDGNNTLFKSCRVNFYCLYLDVSAKWLLVTEVHAVNYEFIHQIITVFYPYDVNALLNRMSLLSISHVKG